MTVIKPDFASPAPRLIDILLHQAEVSTLSPEIEMERHRAISDLLTENNFSLPPPSTGPFRLRLAIAEERLLMEVECTGTSQQETIRLALKPLKQHIRDYALLVGSFYKAAKAGEIYRLETLDEGRRALHDEGAETLLELLENKVILDKATARRLFSLVYVLHIRSFIAMN